MTIPRNLSFLAQGASASGVLGATYGGTGQSSITTGDLLYGSASNTLSKLSIGSTGNVLRVVAGVPAWGTDFVGTVTSVAATVPTFLSIAGSPITSSGTLAITLSGTALPTANGGTGLTSFTSRGVLYASSGSALTTGSALQFDGANLSLGVTASAWGGAFKAIEGNYASNISYDLNLPSINTVSNAYHNGTNWIYKLSSFISMRFVLESNNAYKWYIAPSGTAGNAITYTQAMALDSNSNLSVTATVSTGGYTVAGLPAGVTGMRAYVTNALSPMYGATVVGGGSVTIPVFYNGTNWIVA